MRRPPLPVSRLAAGALAACGALWPVFAAAEPLDRVGILALSHSIGRVEARLEDGRVGVGSAITVAQGILVTNCHVTSQAISIKVIGGGMPWPASEEAADVTHDVCFLRVPEWPHPPVLLRGAAPLRIGDAVVAMGFTAAAMTLRTGAVTSLHAYEKALVIETDTAFTSGGSGGGLFDDEGALIGMLTFRMRGSAGHYFALPTQWIRERLPREHDWRAIAPLAKDPPFWAGEIDKLPLFMRAAALEERAQWSDLRGVADFWTAQEPESADAHRALGVALSHLAAPEAAVESLARAVALAPKNALAWFNLGQVYRSSGNQGALHRVLGTLDTLDEGLAHKLRTDADRPTSSEISP